MMVFCKETIIFLSSKNKVKNELVSGYQPTFYLAYFLNYSKQV